MNLRTFLTRFLFLLAVSAPFLSTALPESSVTGMEVSVETINKGGDLFQANCASCHALNQKLVGPALKGVAGRRSHEWLLRWIRNNEELRKSGDEDAIAIYNEYNGAVMNVFTNLSDEEINSIIVWIEAEGKTGDEPAAAATEGTDGGTVAADPSLIKKVNWGLLLIVIVIAFVVLTVIKILDLVSRLTGREIINWNKTNGTLMILFLIVGMTAAIWETVVHGRHLLPESASEHGVALDQMMNITLIITGVVFFITQILLFYFSWRYQHKKGQKALFYPVNDKLELAWTIIPAIVLTVLVFGGLKAWRNITADPKAGTAEIEIFGYQFGWTARYPGADGVLGNANYNLISSNNELGIATPSKAEALVVSLKEEIAEIEQQITNIPKTLASYQSTLGGRVDDDRKNHLKKIAEIESGSYEKELRLSIRRKNTQIERIEQGLSEEMRSKVFDGTGEDDIVVKEIHIPVNEPVTLRFRGRDVIHSAYLPYFRAQMNVVPGLPTQFSFTPTITTEEMRGKLENPDFDYHIVCNKICGNAHFNMKMKVVVESKKDYEKWLRAQKSFEDGAIMAEDNKATELPAEIQPNNQDTTANNQLAIN
jgi:cytochrome c oxidase subunit 2